MKPSQRLTLWIALGMLLGIFGGLLLGHFVPDPAARKTWTANLDLVTQVFLRLIQMIIAPLVFSTLVAGVAGLGDVRSLGRIGGKTMLWFISAALASLLLGLLLVNVFQPGSGFHLALPAASDAAPVASGLNAQDFVLHLFPRSFGEAMASNNMLQIVIFSVVFGVATAAIGSKGRMVVDFLEAVSRVMLRMTSYVMYLAPLAVAAALAVLVADRGLDILLSYGRFILEFYLGLALLWLLMALAASWLTGKRRSGLVERLKDPMLLAFSTSSSEAAFPLLMERLEEMGCPARITGFVIPLGYSFNLDGTMMYLSFASIFLTQIYGIPMHLGTQISLLLVLMVSSKGVAGVPRASLVVLAGTLPMFHIPEAGILLLLGVDHLLDMGRSATNILGNGLATLVVNRWERNMPTVPEPQP